MIEYYFYLSLSYDECMAYYRGDYEFVQVIEDGGKSIRFPATHIRRFVSSLGIRGRFRLCLTDKNSFISLDQVS